MKPIQIHIGGEHPIDIARAFPHFQCTQRSDEGYRFKARIPPSDGDAFFRALMRIEAELLLEDADAIGTESQRTRDPGELALDAFVLLMERMSRAVGTQTDAQ